MYSICFCPSHAVIIIVQLGLGYKYVSYILCTIYLSVISVKNIYTHLISYITHLYDTCILYYVYFCTKMSFPDISLRLIVPTANINIIRSHHLFAVLLHKRQVVYTREMYISFVHDIVYSIVPIL